MAKVQPGAAISDMRGSLNGLVMTRTRSGFVLRQRPKYKPTFTNSQQAAQQRFTAAMTAWNTLTHTQAAAWNAYAQTLVRHNPTDGTVYAPTGQNLFASLASKLLQVNPGAILPLEPPAESFAPDPIALIATGETGQVAFSASGPNTAVTQTELLVQRLKNERRTPTDKYTSQGFVAFTEDTLTHMVPLAPGWYACAFRFVNADTGQMTERVTLGVVEVE